MMTLTPTLERRIVALAGALRKPTAVAYRTAVEMAGDLGLTLDPWQRGVLESPARNVLMLAARQSGKTTTAALMATHQAVYHPNSLTLIVSPTERQSKLLLRQVIRLYGALRDVVPPVTEGKLSLELRNGSEVVALPGAESNIRGYASVDLLIEDEAAVVDDELYQSARPMAATSNGKIVLMSTPRGRRGHFWREYTEGGDDWHRVRVTAAECPRIPTVWLARERERIGPFWASQEYDVEFLANEGAVFGDDAIAAMLQTDAVPLFAGRIFG